MINGRGTGPFGDNAEAKVDNQTGWRRDEAIALEMDGLRRRAVFFVSTFASI